jgi:hypothetical protein
MLSEDLWSILALALDVDVDLIMPKSSPSTTVDDTISLITACTDTEAFWRLCEEALRTQPTTSSQMQ